jgi:outer membrane protein insertion porin family/translocation and assembly module TamA
VRGYAQNELGSLLYIAPSFTEIPPHDTVTYTTVEEDTAFRRVVPVGGNTLLVGNLELRLRSPVAPELLQFTVFTDAGEVWNRGGGSTLNRVRLKVTPGIQITAFSPVGPVRAAIGYNPYRRPPGPLYYEATNQGGELICVSPGNSLPTTVTRDADGDIISITQTARNPNEPAQCPGTFQPPKETGLLNKLTFSFAIGQAF